MSNLNFNRVIIGGRLTKHPELLSIANSVNSVTNFCVAVTRASKIDGQPDADFFNCTAFNKTAEFITKYFDKGSSIMLEGRLQQRSYTNRDNQKVWTTEVFVSNVYFVDSKSDRLASAPQLVDLSDDEPLPL